MKIRNYMLLLSINFLMGKARRTVGIYEDPCKNLCGSSVQNFRSGFDSQGCFVINDALPVDTSSHVPLK